MHLVTIVGIDVTGNVYERGGVILVDADAIACCSIRIVIDNNVAVDGKLFISVDDNVACFINGAAVVFYQVLAGRIDYAAAANCCFGFLGVDYIAILEVVGVTVGDGQVIAFDGYSGATAGAY